MKNILLNILAVICGAFLGGLVNMGLIIISPLVIPPPEGVNPADFESLKANIHLFGPANFIFPFLAHALGTLVGAFLASIIARSHRRIFALVIGVFFLVGGVVNAFMLPAPAWFIGLDLIVAYIPMALLGHTISLKFRK
jgi:hypothetical protein